MVPSLPEMLTAVALVALTVKVEELPDKMEAGLAAMVTVGARDVTVTVVAFVTVPPPLLVACAV